VDHFPVLSAIIEEKEKEYNIWDGPHIDESEDEILVRMILADKIAEHAPRCHNFTSLTERKVQQLLVMCKRSALIYEGHFWLNSRVDELKLHALMAMNRIFIVPKETVRTGIKIKFNGKQEACIELLSEEDRIFLTATYQNDTRYGYDFP
jgi:hypothetical protein